MKFLLFIFILGTATASLAATSITVPASSVRCHYKNRQYGAGVGMMRDQSRPDSFSITVGGIMGLGADTVFSAAGYEEIDDAPDMQSYNRLRNIAVQCVSNVKAAQYRGSTVTIDTQTGWVVGE